MKRNRNPVNAGQPEKNDIVKSSPAEDVRQTEAKIKKTSWLRRFFCISFTAGVIGAALGAYLYFINGDNETGAQAVIQFNYAGIEDGLDPNGNYLDISKLKSDNIIEDAVLSLGGEAGDLSADTVRKNLSINGVLPDDIIDRLTLVREGLSTESYFEQISDVTYYPAQYVITLKKLPGLSEDATAGLLNAILDGYGDYFTYTYANAYVINSALNQADYGSYDYQEAIDLMSSNIMIMKNYISRFMNSAPDFRAEKSTGLSFADILNSIEVLQTVDLQKLSSYIQQNMVTKDKSILINYYDYQIEELKLELQAKQEEQESVTLSIDEYKKNPIVVAGAENGESEGEMTYQPSEYHDLLVQRQLEIYAEIAEINRKTEEIQARLENLGDVKINTSSYRKHLSYVQAGLDTITGKLVKWTELMQETVKEYFDSVTFKTAYTIAEPASYIGRGLFSMELIKKCVVAGGAAFLLGVLVWSIMLYADMSRRRKAEVKSACN